MTDADGFRGQNYRPHGLPQDVIDPSPEEDDLAKPPRERTSYDSPYAPPTAAEDEDAETASQTSGSSSSSYTYVNSNRVASPPPRETYDYMFPVRRAPESMTDLSYGERSSMDYTPRTSEYAPSYTTEWTPPESEEEEEEEDEQARTARLTSTYVPPAEVEEPPLAVRAARGCFGDQSLLASKHKRCLRVLVAAVLLPLLLWNLCGRSFTRHTFAVEELPQTCNTSPEDTFAMHGSHSLPASDVFVFTEALSARRIMLDGTVHVQPAMDPEATNITVSYTIASPSESALSLSFSDALAELVSHLNAPSATEANILSTHRYVQRRICATAHIVITLPRSVKELTLATTSLTLSLADGVVLETLGATTSHGGIHLSRDAQITNCTTARTSFGSISGTYSLGSHLCLETSAGNINAAIRPQDTPFSPAALTVRSDSGSIHLSVAHGTVPVRNYTADVSTAAGSITGDILLGSKADISTVAGAIRVALVPVGGFGADVNTATKFGSTVVTFQHNLHGKSVCGSHETHTGAVAVKYPGDWEGRVLGTSRLGVVHVRGEGVVVERKERDVVEGYRGDPEAGAIQVASSVGSVEILVE